MSQPSAIKTRRGSDFSCMKTFLKGDIWSSFRKMSENEIGKGVFRTLWRKGVEAETILYVLSKASPRGYVTESKVRVKVRIWKYEE